MTEEELPHQMTPTEMQDLLDSGVDPIDISIQKYEMFRDWCEYRIENGTSHFIGILSYNYSGTCALCSINKETCDTCALKKIKQECCSDNSEISPWRRVEYACKFVDETEERQERLFAAIDNMIETLKQCKTVE